MADPLPAMPGRDSAEVHQAVNTSGSASSANQGKGVQVNLHIQQGEIDQHKLLAAPERTESAQVESSAGTPVHNLAHRDRGFTGREGELASLRERLVVGGAAVVQAVHGMGGVGKTQLALEYAHRHLRQYDVVWWISAEQLGSIGEQFTELGVVLGIVDAAADSTLVKSKVLEHLSVRGRWLLIFDNAVRREDVLPWLPRDAGHVLITSRSANWSQVAQAVELDVMSRDEAVMFLLGQQLGLGSVEAGLLADALGDLPLALTQAVGYLAETGMSSADYRRALVEETQSVLDLGQPVNYPRSLGAAIAMNFEALSREDPAAVAILRLCAFLAPEPVPVDLIAEVARPSDSCPEVLEAIQETVGQPLARQKHIGRIGAYGLARIGAGTITVHRLTQAAIRSLMEPSDVASLAAHLEAVLGAMNPGDPRDAANWPAWGRLLPHLLAVQPGRSADDGLRQRARDAVVYLISRGDPGPARQFAEALHTGWRDMLGPDDRNTLRAATELVWALRDLGKVGQLRPLVEDTLTRQINSFGYDDPDTLRSAADLAVVYSVLGNSRRAGQIQRDVVERRRRLLGEDHPDTLMAAGNLGVTWRELGRAEEALALEQDVLERRRRLLGEDHPDTLMAVGNLGSTLRALGRVEEALALEQDVLERRRRLLGEDHPDTLRAAAGLGSTLHALGRVEEALALEQDVLERRRRLLGEDHPDTLMAVGNLGSTLHVLGRLQE
ncbi:FxSxx-COOH system tetratricopeptide repeat protein, partial [Actinoplanes xinjiangensis]|uniref:FxSxx-COOH system tetratricopeptide repeat protein n=1 Tax=Actinoplanes xinjiangensis TaxID=512350 RepID=UPI003428D8ED